MSNDKKQITVLYVKVGEEPEVRQITDSLETLQELVGGYIEFVSIDDCINIIADEEAKLKSKAGNRRIDRGAYYDIICGNFLVAADDRHGELTSLTKEQIEKYLHIFSEPEDISREQVEETMVSAVVSFATPEDMFEYMFGKPIEELDEICDVTAKLKPKEDTDE